MSEDDTSDVDDWFEEALGESDEDDEPEGGVDPFAGEDDRAEEFEPAAGDDSPVGEEGFGDAGADTDPFGDAGTESDPFGDAGTESDPFGDAGADTDPFGDAGTESDPFGDAGGNDASGEAGAETFGGGGGADLFEDDFGSAFDAAGGGEFDEEQLDSDIPRISLGIEGLDEMIHGGIPERHLMVAIGAPGTGKTTFGLQFLHHGLQQDDNGVFITLEQSRETIIDTANERGWEFDRYEDEEKLAVVDLDPVEMANSLDNIRGELPELITEFDADRLVLDSVSLLEMMYEDQARRRTEVFDFTRSLKDAGVTTFLTSEASDSNPYATRHGIIEYLTDAVFILQYVRSEGGETRLAVEIQKIRNANHSREKKPYDITVDGISVYQQANIF